MKFEANSWGRNLRVRSLRVRILSGAVLSAVAGLSLWASTAHAQLISGPVDGQLVQWLQRMNEASKRQTYQGTFVVSSPLGMSTSKIWHACDGQQQAERVEALTGPARSSVRHNQNVVTFLSDQKVAISEQRANIGMFAGVPPAVVGNVADYYQAKPLGVERVAGVDAEVMHLQPRDSLRYGYKIWSAKTSGVVVKVQTFDDANRMLEQAAFSDLQLNAPLKVEQIQSHMRNTQGYKMERDERQPTTAAAEGWGLRNPIPGYLSNGCLKRMAQNASGSGKQAQPAVDVGFQWAFTDGMASVSLFIEPFDAKRHKEEGHFSMGATNTLTRKVEGSHWLVAMGEVPLTTLRAFASAVQRR
jgi:sigma-E factor negative regulatory protein RseB